MTKKEQLLSDISKIEKGLKSDLEENFKISLREALAKKQKELSELKDEKPAEKKAPAPASTKKVSAPAKKEDSNKSAKSVLDNCKEILRKHNKEKASAKSRIQKRKKQGKPAELTPSETVSKTAKVVKAKIVDMKDKGLSASEIGKLADGIIATIKSTFAGIKSTAEKHLFLANLKKEISYLDSRLSKVAEYGGMFENGGEISEVAEAIFYSNNKKGRISTSFGDKTLQGLEAMIENENYTSEEIANSIFSYNEKNGRISTSFGDKNFGGLLAMINHSREGKLKFHNLGQYADGGALDGLMGDMNAPVQNVGGTLFSTADLTSHLDFNANPMFKDGGMMAKGIYTKADKDFYEFREQLTKKYGVGFKNSELSEKDFDKLNDLKQKKNDGAKKYPIENANKMADGGMMAQGGRYNTGRAWTLDHYQHNKDENYEVPTKDRVYAEGGMTQHGLKQGDKIKSQFDNVVVVENDGKTFIVNLNVGKRYSENQWENLNHGNGKYSKMSEGGLADYYEKKKYSYEEGGVIDENTEMLMSQIKEIKHHAEEIQNLINNNTSVEAWVVAKAERSATDLSDITHYIDGKKDTFEHGGTIKWQDVNVGDSANVKSENKTGVITYAYGRKFNVKFVDGTEKTYDASELEFFKDDDNEMFADGGMMAKGGMVVTSIKDIPNLQQKIDNGEVTYRGLGMGKLSADFFKLTNDSGVRIKVDGKEYYITDKEFNKISRDKNGYLKIKFDAPQRRYDNGGEIDPKGMIYALQNHISTGSIANYTNYQEYSDIDNLRYTALEILYKNGDMPYSLDNLKMIIKQAEELKETRGYADGGTLKGNQYKLDLNKNGRLDKEDFMMLRGDKMADGGVTDEKKKELKEILSKDYETFVDLLGENIKDPKFKDTVVELAKENKVKTKVINVPCTKLLPTQNEISLDKSLLFPLSSPHDAERYLKADTPIKIKNNTILTCDNGKYIIDGHHRWSQVFVLNPKAIMVCTDFYQLKKPFNGLKATQIGISADLGYLPTSNVKDINMLKVSEADLKKYVKEHITEEVREVFKKNGINNPEEHIWKNVVLLKTKNKPIKGASKRDYMPQTDRAENFEKYTPNVSKLKKGGMTDSQISLIQSRTAKIWDEKYRGSDQETPNFFSNKWKECEEQAIRELKKEKKLGMGGNTTFADKVKSIAEKHLKRKKVSPSVQKDYGKTYNKQEALDSAKRIVGAMRKKEMAKKKIKTNGFQNLDSVDFDKDADMIVDNA